MSFDPNELRDRLSFVFDTDDKRDTMVRIIRNLAALDLEELECDLRNVFQNDADVQIMAQILYDVQNDFKRSGVTQALKNCQALMKRAEQETMSIRVDFNRDFGQVVNSIESIQKRLECLEYKAEALADKIYLLNDSDDDEDDSQDKEGDEPESTIDDVMVSIEEVREVVDAMRADVKRLGRKVRA